MKISLQWVNDFVDITEEMKKPQDLAELLTKAGLEVEEVIDRRKDFEFVQVGLILEKDQHPNADRLSVCKVTTGDGVVHQIVCGAKNHKAGDRVVVALPGAVLPGNFAIKQSSLRGVDSGGMLCSTKELGLPGDAEGLLILGEDAVVGENFAKHMKLEDVIFELKVTPNRADCLSHYGLAREIACLTNKELKPLDPPQEFDGPSTQSVAKVEVKDSELCPRYCARVVKGVKVGPSPDWLRNRLESVGLSSINNVVDVTNYVMMELGQPLHAFDLASLAGQKIVVQTATAGERFKTLDGTEVSLHEGELTIRDAEKIVALAGVVGGQNSGVSESTRDILIESASFQAMAVRKASRGHGIETDSAYRFSRGVDMNGAFRAMNRAAELILKVAGGEAGSNAFDTHPEPASKKKIAIRLDQVTERLGYTADEERFVGFMTRLGCQVLPTSAGSYEILPPSFRFDMEQDVDLIEEYARLNGYEHIPETLPMTAKAPLAHDEKHRLQKKVHSILRGQGALQAWNYGFVGSKAFEAFVGGGEALASTGLALPEQFARLRNPLSDDLDIMRPALSFGLYRNLITNARYGNDQGFLYEIGSVFGQSKAEGYQESTRLALVAWGRPRGLWTKTWNHPVVFDVKAAVEALLESLRISSYTWVSPKEKSEVVAFCHRGQFAQLMVEGKKVGFIGTLHPVLLEEEKIRETAAIAEFDLDLLLKGQPRPYRSEALSKFPQVERDFAFVMPKSQRVGEVLREIKKAGGALLVDVDVFDVYEGEKMEEGKKSVAIRLLYQDKNATLQEGQIQELQNKILEQVSKTFGISVR